MDITRRNFVKTTAVSLAMAAAGVAGAGALAGCSQSGSSSSAGASKDGTTTYTGVCRFCGTGCGVTVQAKNGKIVSVAGDPDNTSNKGLNCVEGLLPGRAAHRRGPPHRRSSGRRRLHQGHRRRLSAKLPGTKRSTWWPTSCAPSGRKTRQRSACGFPASSPSPKATLTNKF